MIVVIIAGGSGTRLWPLSTPEYPKHLLKVHNDEFSLLQHSYNRAKKITDKIYVVSEAGHIEHVKEQLPLLGSDRFVVEPARRGTANCIISALVHIASQEKPDEAIAFMHADHYINDVDGFKASFELAQQTAKSEKRIVLVGVEPTEPETGFGYIQKGRALDNGRAFNVTSFKEKPDIETAKKYLSSGDYLWNGGYFVATGAVFVESMKNNAQELYKNYVALKSSSSKEYTKTYISFSSQAIDYALIEREPNLLVLPASFDWMDLGSYADLAKAVEADEQGNHIYGDNIHTDSVVNSYIHNTENKSIAVIGLDNVAIVNTPHGLLITRKDLSQKVGDASKKLNS